MNGKADSKLDADALVSGHGNGYIFHCIVLFMNDSFEIE